MSGNSGGREKLFRTSLDTSVLMKIFPIQRNERKNSFLSPNRREIEVFRVREIGFSFQ
jgi:hypothetical protein